MRIPLKIAVACLLAPFPVRSAAGAGNCLAEGSALYRAGKLKEAAGVFAGEACVSSAGLNAHLNAAVLYKDLGLTDKALDAMREAAKLAGSDPEVLAALGWAAFRAGRLPEAEKAFREALDAAPEHASAQLGVGRVLLGLDKPAEAIEPLKALAARRPDFSLAWLNLARGYETLGKRKKAAAAYERIFKEDWTFYEARLLLARLQGALKNISGAWRNYSRILLVAPRHREAARRERELGKLLGRSSEDALPRQTLAKPLEVHPAANPRRMPTISVGIGTDNAGGPGLRGVIVLRGTGPLWLIDPDTGKRLKAVPGGEDLLLRPQGKGVFQLDDSRRKRLARFSRSIAVEPQDPARDSLILRDVRVEKGYAWSSVRDRQFKGRIEVSARRGRLYAINRLPLEDYLYGVITREMPKIFPAEALKAQAVITRGNGLFWTRHPRHAKSHYDVCDGQHCQVYAGVPGETAQGRRAADATRGLALYYKGRPAHTLFSANCGGHTQDSAELTGWSEVPYLKGALDADAPVAAPVTPWELERWLTGSPTVYCNVPEYAGAAHFRWTRVVSAAELETRVNRIRNIGKLRGLLVLRRSRAGNANSLLFSGSTGSVRVDREQRIRSVLGLASLRSTLFVLETERDAENRPSEFVFYGGGWGHGIGLCQHGAAGRALEGQDFRRILFHYYPGASLKASEY